MVNETLKPSHIRLNNKRLNLLNNYELIQFVTADAFLLIRTPTQKPSCVLFLKFILVPSSTATHPQYSHMPTVHCFQQEPSNPRQRSTREAAGTGHRSSQWPCYD